MGIESVRRGASVSGAGGPGEADHGFRAGGQAGDGSGDAEQCGAEGFDETDFEAAEVGAEASFDRQGGLFRGGGGVVSGDELELGGAVVVAVIDRRALVVGLEEVSAGGELGVSVGRRGSR